MFHRFRPFVAVVIAFFCFASAHAGPYSALYAFGDSLSDVGNDLIISSNQAPEPTIYTSAGVTGRFTNGTNYLDGLASNLGLGALAPSLAGGTIYAYGGARSNYAGLGLPAQASFDKQIDAYVAPLVLASKTAEPNALYVLWIGANDMADAIGNAVVAYITTLTTTGDFTAANNAAASIIGAAIQQVMNSIGQAITQLAGLGAKHFLVPNIPDLALTPRVSVNNSPTLNSLATGASIGFNLTLANVLDLFPATLDVRELDIFSALNAIVADPAHYGITNVADACYTGEVDGTALPPGGPAPTVCSSPMQYIFWDYEHPTSAVHGILAQQATAVAVPEPPAIVLLVLAMASLATFMRRRKQLGR